MKELKEAKIWVQFSQIWEGNTYTERKGCLPEVHSSVLCPEVWLNGINLKNLITRRKLQAAVKLVSFPHFGSIMGVGRSNWSNLFFDAFLIGWLIVLDGGRNLSSIFSLPIQSILFFSASLPMASFCNCNSYWYNLCNIVHKICKVYKQIVIHIITLTHGPNKSLKSEQLRKKREIWTWIISALKHSLVPCKQEIQTKFKCKIFKIKVFDFTLGSVQAVMLLASMTIITHFSISSRFYFTFLYNTFHRKW